MGASYFVDQVFSELLGWASSPALLLVSWN